ncbi:hypothetical protein ACWDR1_05395 [Streptosporangium sandarakinum]
MTEQNTDRKKSSIPELSTIELRSTAALKQYVDASRALAREFAGELEWAAEELTAVLTVTAKGNPWLMGMDVKIRARRVANRARRASELQRGSAIEMVKLWQDFLVQFAPAIEKKPNPKVKSFDFDA